MSQNLGADLPLCVELLASTDAGERLLAAERLGELGDLALPAAPALIRALGDSDPAVGCYAASALTRMDTERLAAAMEPGCLAGLFPARRSGDRTAEMIAEELLMRVFPATEDFLAAAAASLDEGMVRRLIDVLLVLREPEREWCSELLARNGPSLPLLMRILREEENRKALAPAAGVVSRPPRHRLELPDDPRRVLACAVGGLSHLPPSPEITEALFRIVDRDRYCADEAVVKAARALGKNSDLDVRIMRELATIAIDDDVGGALSDACVDALIQIGRRARTEIGRRGRGRACKDPDIVCQMNEHAVRRLGEWR